MNLRNIVLLTGLAALMGGCVVTPRSYPPQAYYPESGGYYYDDYYYDYHDTPSYEGYYYARVIFIGSIPYYVDDDRRIRPIPPQLQDHFRRYPYGSIGRGPVFSPEREVRNGYPMSRIVYFNNVPYYVEDGRAARPLPNNLQDRFRYSPPVYGNRPQPPMMRGNDPHNVPPAYGRDIDRREQPVYDRGRDDQPVYMPGPQRNDGYPYGNGRMMPPDRQDPRQVAPMPQSQPYPQQVEDPRGNPGFGGGRMMPPDREDPHRVAPQPFPQQAEDPHGIPAFGGGRMMPPDRQDPRQVAPMSQPQPFPQQDQRSSGDPRGGIPFGGRGMMRPNDRPQPSGGDNRPAPDKRKPRGENNGDRNGRGN